MKRIVLFLVSLVLLTFSVKSQNSPVEKTFNKYAFKDGFSTVDISGQIVNMFLPEDERIDDDKIGSIKILTVEDKNLNNGLDFYGEIIPKLNVEDDYNTWMHIIDDNERVIFMNKKKGKGKPEFLMVVGGSDNSLIYVEGSFNFKEASKISDVINSKEFKKKAGAK